jgi:hypothetical protein
MKSRKDSHIRQHAGRRHVIERAESVGRVSAAEATRSALSRHRSSAVSLRLRREGSDVFDAVLCAGV